MLTNEEFLGVFSSKENRFKIFYHIQTLDLIIAIAIDDNEKKLQLISYIKFMKRNLAQQLTQKLLMNLICPMEMATT